MATPETESKCGMTAVPEPEHRWLHRLVGEWTFEGEATMAPGSPPERFAGTESVRSLGGLWILAEGRGEMPGGGTANTLMTLGYDPHRRRFVGTFVASMMTHLWVYEGALDGAGTVLGLDTEGPNPAAGGRMAKFRDEIELRGDDHRVLTSRLLGEDRRWHPVMTSNYRRLHGERR
ncbi:MAG: DUF1579 domain-containing protein [Deferrisomatales bacterium]